MSTPYDAAKNAENIRKHGLSFSDVNDVDWNTAFTAEDTRKDYGETRHTTYVMRFGRLHCLVWTWRDGALRPISFRKANSRERKRYGQ